MKISILLLALLTACSTPPTYDLVIQNVGLFDGEKDLGVVNIAISGDTIAAISTNQLKSDSVIDATDKYLIPGLVNSHAHLWQIEQLKEGYDVGILANMGMHASNHSRDSTLKAESQKEGFPFYYTAGVAATVPGGHPTQITPNIKTINDSVSVKMFVDDQIANGADFIKIIKESSAWFGQAQGPPSLPYDSIEKIITYTHSRGLKVVVHIGSLEEMISIARLKPDGFAHTWYSAINADINNEQLQVLKESGAFVVPTLLINERILMVTEKEGGPLATWAKENFLNMDKMKAHLKLIHDAGVTILAGTDNGNFDLNWGDDLLKELDLYSQAGLSNIEVLKTATGNSAEAWDIPIGILQVGSKANMLMLDGNPVDDLAALKNINTIWKNGVPN